jgi:hypothetical protein
MGMKKGGKIIAASAVGMLLGFGLCGSVSGETNESWRLTLGTVLLISSVIGFVLGCVIDANQPTSKPPD